MPRSAIAVLVLGTLLLWLSEFRPPTALRGVRGDPSWFLANVWFLLTGAQAGVDYVLTCGPLGFVEWGNFHARTYWPVTWWWEGLFQLGGALTFSVLVLRLSSWPARIAALVLMLLLYGVVASHAVLLMLGSTLLALEPGRWRRLALPWAALVLTAYGALKFSYFLFSVPCALVLVLAAGLMDGLGAALRRAALVAAIFLLVWTAVLGQSPGNVLAYALGGWEISQGYGEALSRPAPARQLALAGLAWAGSLLALALFALDRSARPRRVLVAGLAAAGLFLTFKMSFTRHGGGNPFFVFAVHLPLLLWGSHLVARREAALPARARPLLVALAVAFVPGFLGLRWLPQTLVRRPLAVASGQVERLRLNLSKLLDLRGYEREQQQRMDELRRESDLPALRAALGGRQVDLLGISQAALLLNGIAWHPRPVFHGYHTNTPALRRLNLEAFLRPDFPGQVLVKPYSVDGLFLHHNDPDILRLVARDHRPRLEEGGFLLLERVAPARPLDVAALETLLERTLSPGELVTLPPADDAARVLLVDWPWSLAGRALGFAYHHPRVDLVWELEDGTGGRGRVTPTVLRDGILLDPFLQSLEDWRGWYAGERGRRVRHLALEVEPGAAFTLAPTLRLRVARDPTLRR